MRIMGGVLSLGLALTAVGGSSCTVIKPVTCAVIGPFILASQSEGTFFRGDPVSPEAAAVVLGLFVGVCAAGGLVTGFVSDVNYLMGSVVDPTRNICHPFVTNTDASAY
jgi:hypothetical protein